MFEMFYKIKEHLLTIINFQSSAIKKIKTLLFAGSPILFDLFKNIDDLGIKNFIKLENPELAIADGSVLYNYDPYIINSRKANFTIGVKTSDIWDDKAYKKGGLKRYDPIGKVFRCENLFTKLIVKFLINLY